MNRAALFRELHVAGRPLVLFNVWDPGSAKAVAAGGARALATGSWSVAAAHGFDDGERIPLDLALDNLSRIVHATDLPVTVDLESGYTDVGETVARAVAAGAIGCNLEDSVPSDGSLREIAVQIERLKQARRAAGAAFFINARSDVFFQKPPHTAAMVEAALERARAYAEAGADGLFLPGLTDEALMERAVKGSPLPLNIMASPHTPPLARLAQLGVARVSHGPGPYRLVMKALEEAARAAMSS